MAEEETPKMKTMPKKVMEQIMPDYYKKPYAYKAYKERYGSSGSKALNAVPTHTNATY